MGRTDVLQGETSRERASQSMGLVIAALFFALAAVPYPGLTPEDSAWGYSGDLWYMRAFAVVVALTGVRGAFALRRPPAAETLEIGPDALRWSDGRGKQRTIARVAVREVRFDPVWLHFDPAADPIRELHVIEFDSAEMQASLDRHGWLKRPDRRIDDARKRVYPSNARRLGRISGRLFGR